MGLDNTTCHMHDIVLYPKEYCKTSPSVISAMSPIRWDPDQLGNNLGATWLFNAVKNAPEDQITNNDNSNGIQNQISFNPHLLLRANACARMPRAFARIRGRTPRASRPGARLAWGERHPHV